jgi:hypothetical protein
MKRSSRDEYLDQTLRALVAFFGVEAVKHGIAVIERIEAGPKRPPSDRPASTGGLPKVIAALSGSDPARFDLLRPFFERIVAGEVLPQSEDIRRFAELLRVKEPFPGKSRRDLISHLAGSLLKVPVDELRTLIHQADSIREEQRRKGYSLLTDHLLRNSHVPAYWSQPSVAAGWLRETGWTITGNRARKGGSDIPAPQHHKLYDLHDVATEEGIGASEVVRQITEWAGRGDVAGDPKHPPTPAQIGLAERRSVR